MDWGSTLPALTVGLTGGLFALAVLMVYGVISLPRLVSALVFGLAGVGFWTSGFFVANWITDGDFTEDW